MNEATTRKSAGHLSRRELLAGMVGGTLAAALTRSALAAAAVDRVQVVRVESTGVWRGDARDPEMVAEMIRRGVTALARETAASAAWRHFLNPSDRVGLKINLLGRPLVYTGREVADAIVVQLMQAGVSGENIIIWDRPESHFGPTAYALGRGRHGETIMAGGDYHLSYRDRRSCVGTSQCGMLPVDLIPFRRTDVTVNLPVLKDHSVSGTTGALKNVAFGCYHTIPQCHDNGCDPFIAEACAHFLTVNRIPLIILDATEGCFEGGPVPNRRDHLWRENAIYFATDPVALDRVCYRLIMEKRAAMGLSAKPALHIETAAAKGLGVGDIARIDLVTIAI